MLMQPLKSNAGRSTTSTVKFVDPPTKGWNERDDLSAMDKDEAIVLDNLVPSDTGIFLRPGYSSWVTGLGSDVRSLMEYSGASSSKLFAATATAIYDVTSTGAVGAAVVSSLTSGHWQHVMFTTAGGSFLVLANGADSVRNYDGTTWTATYAM